MNKKIIISLSVIAAVTAIVIGGTVAFFSDTETSTGNTFTAGSLDLKVGSECHYNGMECIGGFWVGQPGGYPVAGTACACSWLEKDLATGDLFFNFDDVKPGDEGENTIGLTVYDNDAHLCAYVKNLVNQENGCNGPEAKADQTCGNPGIGEGELQDNLYVTIWRDTDCDNVLYEGTPAHCTYKSDSMLDPMCAQVRYNHYGCTETMASAFCKWVPAVAGEVVLVNNLPIDNNQGVWPLGQLVAENKTCFGFAWNIPSNVGNIIQGDSVKGDIEFYVEQVRNNPNFTCPVPGQPQ